MSMYLHLLIDFTIIIFLIVGIRCFRTPGAARLGNLTAAVALLCGLVLVLFRNRIIDLEIVITALFIGAVIGWVVAMRVGMIKMPAMVAFQNGAGGLAAFLVAFIELTRGTAHINAIHKTAGILGLIVGAATFSGSMIASAKLENKMKTIPTFLPGHNLLLLLNGLVIVVIGGIIIYNNNSPNIYPLITLLFLSFILAVIFTIRIGGADMPVIISFLNATSGLAGALTGIVMQNKLLIACGATVASSGTILTHAMCKAMNRSLLNVFVGIKISEQEAGKGTETPEGEREIEKVDEEMIEKDTIDNFERARNALQNSHKIVIIPGYGMALAQAQFKIVELANQLEKIGKEVKFAIHPVAGRMPGHMNVLLAEAEIDYDKLVEMDDINPEFEETDTVLIAGACDVVNPAAIEKENTPISGMPILMAHKAINVVVCNLDEKPGYSGVENPLYKNSNTVMLLGDAKDTIDRLLNALAV